MITNPTSKQIIQLALTGIPPYKIKKYHFPNMNKSAIEGVIERARKRGEPIPSFKDYKYLFIPSKKSSILELFKLGWKDKAIAAQLNTTLHYVYQVRCEQRP